MCNGTLVDKNTYADDSRQFGEGFIEIFFSPFREYAIQLKASEQGSEFHESTVGIVPEKLNVPKYGNDARLLQGLLPSSAALSIQQREANVKFNWKSGVVGRTVYAQYDLIQNQLLQWLLQERNFI